MGLDVVELVMFLESELKIDLHIDALSDLWKGQSDIQVCDFVEMVKREIKEETNLRVNRLIEKFTIKKGNLIEHVFYGIVPMDSKENIVLNHESDNFNFFTIEQIKELDTVPELLNYVSLVLFNKEYETE